MDGRNLSPKIESPLKEVTFFWPWHFGFGACILFYLKKANLMKKPVFFYIEPLALLPYRYLYAVYERESCHSKTINFF